jgi:TolB protein
MKPKFAILIALLIPACAPPAPPRPAFTAAILASVEATIAPATEPSIPSESIFLLPPPGMIAFASDQDNPNLDIFLATPDGAVHNLTADNPDFPDVSPAWSPDGSRLAYAAQTREHANFEIYLLDFDGGNLGRLTVSGNEDRSFVSPAWSPDGAQIVLVERITPSAETPQSHSLYLMDAGGERPCIERSECMHELYFSEFLLGDPAWSPDGARIAFYAFREGAYHLFTIAPDGSNLIDLTQNTTLDPQAAKTQLNWSPDGARLIFTAGEFPASQLYIINADGSGLTLLVGGESLNAFPAWSPDGSQIIFISNRDGNSELYLIRPDGSNLTRLTDSPAFEQAPAWRP